MTGVASAQEKRNDREIAEANHWIYNDFDKGIQRARASAKPLMVVIRCPPWASCAEFDEQVVRRHELLRDMMDKFVRVRLVRVNKLDLSLFQFDPDLTFAVFFLNADKTIYGRFGSRSDFTDSDRDISLEGLRKAMSSALALHKQYPENKALLTGKTVPKPRFCSLV